MVVIKKKINKVAKNKVKVIKKPKVKSIVKNKTNKITPKIKTKLKPKKILDNLIKPKLNLKQKNTTNIKSKKTKKIVRSNSNNKKIVRRLIVKSIKEDIVIPQAKLQKIPSNPIISPSLYSWESKATFNPAALEDDGKIYILYRATGEDDSSVIGYALSYDGFNIEDRPTYFIYKRSNNFIKSLTPIDYSSGGGENGGCEDPRISLIDGVIYMIYTAFDGWSSLRMALTSISLKDFRNKKWNWKKEVLISPPGEMNKNWVLFPEKINGKFAIMHSFYPEILIDYFDSLDEFDGSKFIKSNNTRPVDKSRTWDSWFRGVGPTPIKTDEGWLVLYHAMDHKNSDRYRLGALILDIKNPTKILYRSKEPILEPEEVYENDGHKWGVVYSCGAVVKNGELFVYYGGSDKFVCVASMPLKELINDLKKDKVTKLKTKNKLIK